MMRSMYASVSGLKVHQEMMDVIGNNISNINTIAYKSSRITFKEMLTQTLKGASAPQEGEGKGGTNPMQIGLGVSTGSIDSDMSSGNLQPTGKKSDVAIQGDGFFIVNDGEQFLFTRAGSFNFDKNGYLYSSTSGFKIQGWLAGEDGTITDLNPDNIKDIVFDKSMNPDPTKKITYNGNLDAGLENKFEVISSSMDISDGTAVPTRDSLHLTLEPGIGFNNWDFTLAGSSNTTFGIDADGDGLDDNQFTGSISLDENGAIESFIDTNGNDLLAAGSINVTDVAGTGNTTTINVNNDLSKLFAATNVADSIMETEYTEKTTRTVTTSIYDQLGKKHNVKLVLEKTDNNQWVIKDDDNSVKVSDAVSGGDWFGGEDHQLSFSDGKVAKGDTVTLSFQADGVNGTQTIDLDLSEITQFAGNMTVDFKTADGYSQGDFQTFSIDDSGTVTGSYDNGQNKVLAQIAMANFSNPAGLVRDGGVYRVSTNSGQARIGQAGVNGIGKLAPSTLEMSNVDLAEEFTKMITAQRGFQANSKLIATSDEMMQQLVNLKR